MLDMIEHVLNWCTKNWESITLVGTGILTWGITAKSKNVVSAKTVDLDRQVKELKKLSEENTELKTKVANQNEKIDMLTDNVKNLAGICYSGFMNSNIRYKNDVQHYYDGIKNFNPDIKEIEPCIPVEEIASSEPKEIVNRFIEARKNKYAKKD